ncbi:MAG: 2-amino-4-hydroxy-6-hydroxymethyldihydropteridine diphosphokinase [Gammaproteobacteria bacterium]|nr:2-amino-4-hydroxy-6-hydroxymethyldihydropteridine diphosphokinase [Gammaproteobacteria bacterium]
MHAGTIAYIGLGSNLDNPAAQLRRALAELTALPDTRELKHSRLYLSKPLGPQHQPDYLNAVAALQTRLEPLVLMRQLQGVERQHGRRRSAENRWGPRTLDLDLLVYGNLSLQTPELTLPHPELQKRSFVLYPLAELVPELVIPGHGTVRQLRERCTTPAIALYEEAAHA